MNPQTFGGDHLGLGPVTQTRSHTGYCHPMPGDWVEIMSWGGSPYRGFNPWYGIKYQEAR